MLCPMSPAERLLDRLMMGYTDPDDELMGRAHSFRAWADRNPSAALRWLPRLRRTHYCTARLWKAVEHIVDPRVVPPRQPVPASVERPPAPLREEVRPGGKETSAEVSREAGFPVEYDAWRRTLPPAAVADAVTYAPARAREALDLEARARQPITAETKRVILKRAVAVWCTLLNIKEPALW